ncbi:MAG: MFS transporter [Finegoldia sp.]|nr:MFS transporter [Finegoldia sp.]
MNKQPALVLPKNKRIMASIGSIFLILTLQLSGQSLNTIQGPLLESMGGAQYFSLAPLAAILGMTILTPIGGKLGDIFGRRNIVLFSGIVIFICKIAISFTSSPVVHVFFRFMLGAASGCFISVPFILAREINEESFVPKMMGFLASGMAIGGLLGGVIAGALMDMGHIKLAILFPIITLVIGVTLITVSLPNQKSVNKAKVDVVGIITLAISLTILVLALNFGPKVGLNLKIILGIVIGIVFGVIFIKNEKKAENPIVPLHLLSNKSYVVLLAIGFIGYFYNTAMNVYAPKVVIDVMQQPKSVAGMLQLPRTIITMILPIFTGAWVAKKFTNHKISMLIATGLTAIPMFVMAFAGSGKGVILYMAMLGVTGIAESFRGVSVTTVAQTRLEAHELGIGTALVNFVNTFASLAAASIFGIAYDIKTKADPLDPARILAGADLTYIIAGIVGVIGVLIVLFMTSDIFKKDTSNLK